jgi:hypothetical protein
MSLIGVGLRDFVPGAFAVPENPVMRGMAGLMDFVPGAFAVPENPVMRGQGVGNLVPSAPMYPIPANSVITAWKGAGMAGLGCGSSKDDCGCGCGGHKSGMGDTCVGPVCWSGVTTAFTDLSTAVTSMSLTPLTSTDFMYLGGTAVAAWLLLGMFGKKGRR